MRSLLVFLVGITLGVATVRLTEGLAASQLRLLEFFSAGAAIGLAAAGICIWGWRDEQ